MDVISKNRINELQEKYVRLVKLEIMNEHVLMTFDVYKYEKNESDMFILEGGACEYVYIPSYVFKSLRNQRYIMKRVLQEFDKYAPHFVAISEEQRKEINASV